MLAFCGFAHACDPPYVTYRYMLHQGQFVYAQIGQPGSTQEKIEVQFVVNNANQAKFRSVAISPNKTNAWDDGNHFHQAANYFTDSERVYWNGVVLNNPTDAPKVDAASFVQPFWAVAFAADKNSLYFNGVRTDDNTGEWPLDVAALKQLDEYVMSDGHHLYHDGKKIGAANGYQVIKTQNYGGDAVCWAGHYVIARNASQVFVDGNPIDAHPDSFRIKRWMPKLLLDYVDQTGAHTYRYGLSEAQFNERLRREEKASFSPDFVAAREKVLYPVDYNPQAELWNSMALPNVDPEKFVEINQRVGTDGLSLYELQGDLDKEKPLRLKVTALDEPNLKMSEPLTVGRSHVYFINDEGVRTYAYVGRWVPINESFAHDDQYIYIIRTGQRFKTANAQAVKLENPNDDSLLSTAEGFYGRDDQFVAANTAQWRYLDEDQEYAADGRRVYYDYQVIKGADAASFQVKDGKAFDRLHSYTDGVIQKN